MPYIVICLISVGLLDLKAKKIRGDATAAKMIYL